jgi:hypothetical protein
MKRWYYSLVTLVFEQLSDKQIINARIACKSFLYASYNVISNIWILKYTNIIWKLDPNYNVV